MIGLDTNILVRYFMADDPMQSAGAARLLESLTPAEPGYISLVVVAELVWVLPRIFRVGRLALADIVERVLQVDAFVVQRRPEVHQAMLALRTGAGDFADALIGALAHRAGCSATVTFDAGAQRLPGFRRL